MKIIQISTVSRFAEFIIIATDKLDTSDEACENDAESIFAALTSGVSSKTWDLVLAKMVKYQQDHDDI